MTPEERTEIHATLVKCAVLRLELQKIESELRAVIMQIAEQAKELDSIADKLHDLQPPSHLSSTLSPQSVE